MTDNAANNGGADAGPALIADGSPDEQADLVEKLTVLSDEIILGSADDDEEADEEDNDDDLAGELTGADSSDPAGRGVPGSGALSGGFGLAGLALAVVSLTTNWTSSVVIGHSQYVEEIHAPSSGLTAQQQLDMYADAWRTQGWWALAFAGAAVLLGAGALVLPWIQRGRGALPGWARAIATAAIVVGLVGLLLAVLTVVGVFGGHLTAPSSAG